MESWEELLEQFGYDDWEVDDDGSIFTCPHGHRIEPDGRCPEGCESPLLSIGMI